MTNSNDVIAYDDAAGNTFELPGDQFASMESAAGAVVKTPTASFSFAYNGLILNYTIGDPFTPDAALLAALTAASAPIQ